MGIDSRVQQLYEWKHYKKLLILPVFVFFILFLFSTQVKLGIDLRGGVLLSAPIGNQSVDDKQLVKDILQNFQLEELSIRKASGAHNALYIQFTGEKNLLQAQELMDLRKYNESIQLLKSKTGEINATGSDDEIAASYFSKARENFKNSLISLISAKAGVKSGDISLSELGPSLGQFFLGQAQTALIMASVFILIMIFYFYRSPIVSFAVVQAAFFDAFAGYAILGALGIPLSLATIAPLLMLIGYSVDTDIMLTDRILKRKGGTPASRAAGAFKTGITMICTAIGALFVLYFVASYANIEVLANISLVLIAGLICDIMCTYITNATVVLWHLERSGK